MEPGAEILAHADDGHRSGNVDFIAIDLDDPFDPLLFGIVSGQSSSELRSADGLNNALLEQLGAQAEETLMSLAGEAVGGNTASVARVRLDGATVTGGDVSASAVAINAVGFEKHATAEVEITGNTTIDAANVALFSDVSTSLLSLLLEPLLFETVLYTEIDEAIPEEEIAEHLRLDELITLEEVLPLERIQQVLDAASPEDLQALYDTFAGGTRQWFYSYSNTDSHVAIDGASQISASGDVSLAVNNRAVSRTHSPGYMVSAGVAITDSNTSASLAEGALIDAGGAVDIRATSVADNAASVNPAFGAINKPFAVAFAWSDQQSETTVTLDSTSRVEAASFRAEAEAIGRTNTVADAKQLGGNSVVLAAAVNFAGVDADARVAGTVVASGDVDIHATADLAENLTSADARSISNGLGFEAARLLAMRNIASHSPGFAQGFANFWGPVPNRGQAFNATGASAYSDSRVEAAASLENGASVVTGEDLRLYADTFNRSALNATARSNSSGSDAFGGALALGRLDNDARAIIGAATVDAGGDIIVHADAEIPAPWNFDFTDIGIVRDYLAANPFGFLLTSHTGNSSDGVAGGHGQAIGLSLLDVGNHAEAGIGDEAAINQSPDPSSSDQSVSVSADARTNLVTGAGGGLLSTVLASSLGSAVGGVVNAIFGDTGATAAIGDNAEVHADEAIEVLADSNSNVIEVAVGGAASSKMAIEGAGAGLEMSNRADASIGAGARLDGGDIAVRADADVKALLASGGLVRLSGLPNQAGNVGVGVSASLAMIDNDASAELRGEGDNRGDIEASSLTVLADTDTQIGSFSLAGVVATQPGASLHQSGIGISGDAALNQLTSSAKTTIDDWQIATGGAVRLQANERSAVESGAGAVVLSTGTSDGIAGSLAQNEIQEEAARVVVRDSDIAAAEVELAADLDSQLLARAASGRATARGAGVAGAVARNDAELVAESSFEDGSNAAATGRFAVEAQTRKAAEAIAGAITAAARIGKVGAGLGASFATNEIDDDTAAQVADATVVADGDVLVTAQSDLTADAYSVSVGASLDEMVPAASVTLNRIGSDTSATASSDSLRSGGSMEIAAEESSELFTAAGGLSLAGNTATFGGANATTDHRSDVTAAIGDDSIVAAAGAGAGIDGNRGLIVRASSQQDTQSFAVGGGGAGGFAVAGSATVDLLSASTRAGIGAGASINSDNDNAAADQSVLVLADSDTSLSSVAGAVALGSKGGAGAGVSAAELGLDTRALIGDGAAVRARGDVVAEALSSETLVALTGAIAAGASLSMAGAGSGYRLNNRTEAAIGRGADVAAGGNVVVSADDVTEIDLLTGAVMGGSVNVALIDKEIVAEIGAGATIEAAGSSAARTVRDGSFSVDPSDGSGAGEVDVPQLAFSTGSGAYHVDLPAGHSATANQRALHGVAVSATNRDNIETLAASGSANLSGAVAVAANVVIADIDTRAGIGDGARVNTDRAAADEQQSVLVAAGNDFYRLGMAGVAAGGGTAGIAPGADTTILTAETTASVGAAAIVRASQDVGILARAAELLNTLVAGLGIGGTAGVAGAGAYVQIDNRTSADTGVGSVVSAGGSVEIAAEDDTEMQSVSGAAAFSLGTGVGGSLAMHDIRKQTEASIGDHAAVTALGHSGGGGVELRARSTEDMLSAVASGAGGYYAGLAGAVSINLIDSDTTATAGEQARINEANGDAAAGQSVQILASNDVGVHALAGSVGGAVVGGIAGSFDLGVVRNDTVASVQDGATIRAAGDVQVSAEAQQTLGARIASASGGSVAVAGAVGVHVLGDQLDSAAQGWLSFDGKDATDYNDEQARDDTATSSLASSSETAALAGDAAARKAHVGVGDKVGNVEGRSLTAASLGSNAQVDAGGNLVIQADDRTKLDVLSGTAAVGAIGVGAGVAVARTSRDVAAFAGAGSQLAAGQLLQLHSSRDVDAALLGYAGTISLKGGDAVLVALHDDADSEAIVDAGASIESAGTVEIVADDVRRLDVEADGVSIAAIAAVGASLAEASASGASRATIGAGAEIGTVGKLELAARSDTDIEVHTLAAKGGVLGGGSGSVALAGADNSTLARVGEGARLDVGGGLSFSASALSDVEATAAGINGGAGLAVGASVAEAEADHDVLLEIGASAALDATGDVILQALYNTSEEGDRISGKDTRAVATASAGALGGSGVGATANADEHANVEVTLGAGARLSGASTGVYSGASLAPSAVASGDLGAALAVGVTRSDAAATLSNQIILAEGASLSASGDAVLSALSDTRADGHSRGGQGGVASVASTEATAEARDRTRVVLTPGAAVTASGDVDIAALSRLEARSDARITTGGAVTFNRTDARATGDAQPVIEIGSGAALAGENVSLQAWVDSLRVAADAFSKTFAVASTTRADADVDAAGRAAVTVAGGAELTATGQLGIEAGVSGVDTDAHGKATIEAGVTGVVIANAANDLDLDADVAVQAGAALFSNDLVIRAVVPEDRSAVWKRDADADAQTVVSYITETIKIIEKKTKKIPVIGWIVKKITRTVTRVVEVVLQSDERAKLSGHYAANNTIQLDGEIYQSGSLAPELVVAEDGSITRQRNVDATVAGDEVIVAGLNDLSGATIVLEAAGGTVSGSGTIHINDSVGAVSIVNHSDKTLRIGDLALRTLDLDSDEADITVVAEHDLTEFQEVTESDVASVLVHNMSAADIVFEGLLSNLFGGVTIINDRGDIAGSAGHRIETQALVLRAAEGDVGAHGAPLLLELAKIDSNPNLSAVAGGDIHLDTTLVEYAEAEPVPGHTIDRLDLGELRAGGALHLGAGGAVVFIGDELERTAAGAIYRFGADVTAGGDIKLAGSDDTIFRVDGSMTSGIADLAVTIDANGAVDPATLAHLVSATETSRRLEAIGNQGGTVSIAGGLEGAGRITVLDGYSHVTVANHSSFDLVLGDIDLAQRTDGGVLLNGTELGLGGTVGGVSLERHGYASGSVDITNHSAATLLTSGAIANPTGTTRLVNEVGNIAMLDNSAVIGGNEVVLAAALGTIGPDRPLRLDVGGGAVTASASGDIDLEEVDGDLRLNQVISAAGDIHLIAAGSVLAGDTAEHASARQVRLHALGGSIGTADRAVAIDSNSADLNAAGDIHMVENRGDLNVSANAGGDAHLTARAGSLLVDRVAAGGTARFNAWAGILDAEADAAADIEATSIELIAAGAIGTAADAVDIDSSRLVAGRVDASAGLAIHLAETEGDLAVGAVVSANGNVDLEAANGDLRMGQVQATTGEVRLTAAKNIVAEEAGLHVAAANVALQAGGGIGTADRAVEVDAGYRRAGEVRATAGEDLHLFEVSGDLQIAKIEAGGNVTLQAAQSIVAGDSAISGGDIRLIAIGGSIGNRNRSLRLDSRGQTTLEAAGDIYLIEQDGDARIASARSGEIVSLQAIGGGVIAEHLAAGRSLSLSAAGDIDVALAQSASLTVTALAEGGAARIGILQMDGRRLELNVLADHIAIGSLVASGKRPLLNLDLRGNDGGLAEMVTLQGELPRSRFRHLYSNRVELELGGLYPHSFDFKDLVLRDGGRIGSGLVEVEIGPGEAPLRLLIRKARVRTRPRSVDRVILITPRAIEARGYVGEEQLAQSAAQGAAS
ncbi:MAG TPA: hypothetical protein VEB21_17770 [Terriglobales bacterium]|nr:hypothetical protein [Terriglobales bacterium]